MSFILDALRKLERQKQEGGMTSDSTTLRGGRPFREGRRGTWILWGSALVAVAALVVAAVALFQSVRIRAPEPQAPLEVPKTPSEHTGPEAKTAPSLPPALEEPDPGFESASEAGVATPTATVPVASATPADTASTPADDSQEVVPEEEEALTAQSVRLVGLGASERPAHPDVDLDPASFEIPEGLPELILQGTSIIGGKPVAVVNYQRLFEGDFIEGARVVHISENVVELEYKSKRFKIKF